ncbi:MAG: EAL domain-containing protein [Treponema sp.]|nr:EAL domain-containing protein [Treponema sp.]
MSDPDLSAAGGDETIPLIDLPPEDSLFSEALTSLLRACRKPGGETDSDFQILFDGSPDMLLVLGPDGVFKDANPSFLNASGYDIRMLKGRSVLEILEAGYREGFKEKLAAISRTRTAPGESLPREIFTFRGLKPDGSSASMECLLVPVRIHGRSWVLAAIRNLTLERRLLEELRESEEQYAALSETISEAIFRIDENLNILFANSGAQSTFGYSRDELVGQSFRMLFPEEVFRTYEDVFRKYFYVDDKDRPAMGLRRTLEVLGVTKNRGVTPMEMSFGNSKVFKERTLTCIVRDISHRKTLERKLRHLAYHDRLTGLANRELFHEDLQAALSGLEKDKTRKHAVLFMDLDGFKQINDTLGHDRGDRLLVEAARRIRDSLRDADTAYRLGGDEFTALLSGIRKVQDALVVAERIQASIRQPFFLEGAEDAPVSVGVSIGIAVIPDDGTTVLEVTKCADIAMYRSKDSGKGRCTVYDPAMDARVAERWRMAQEIRTALVRGEFRLYYQPIVDQGGMIRGMEALLRWPRQDGTAIPPSVFVPVAEESGTIFLLGKWVLHRALADLRALQERNLRDVYVAVNLSGRQFEQAGFAESLVEAVRGSGVDPGRLRLELTETTLMRNPAAAAKRIQDIKDSLPGLRFMIDDFGTGYSSLAYLSNLPVDSLKIDLSFVANLSRSQNEKVVKAIINLGHSLEMGIVAEGIETRDQRSYFVERSCQGMQGFYFMKAAPLSVVLKRLERQLQGIPPFGEEAGLTDAAGA